MYFLLSGEGPWDIGTCTSDAEVCEGDDYQPGPMAVMADQIVEARHKYSPLESGCCGFVHKSVIERRESELKAVKKPVAGPGKRRAIETHYFFRNARSLAKIAIEQEGRREEEVVAVLFRDADTATAGRGSWEDKRRAVLDGFQVEGFSRGVPMIPKPTSEAWLLCALKSTPYQNCEKLEERSARPKSANSLKDERETILGGEPTREMLCDLVAGRTVDINRIEMPSFAKFRSRLKEVI
jgi:hypothetical protein